MSRRKKKGGQASADLMDARPSGWTTRAAKSRTAANAGTEAAATEQEAEFCRQLSQELHDLKNRLWPIAVNAEYAPTAGVPRELADLIEQIATEARAALAIAARMSAQVNRHSENGDLMTIGGQLDDGLSATKSKRRMRIL
jgi:hypothetical protein